MSGSGIGWAICNFVPCSRQTTTPAPTTLFFTGRMPFLSPSQQRQSTEGIEVTIYQLTWQYAPWGYLVVTLSPSLEVDRNICFCYVYRLTHGCGDAVAFYCGNFPANIFCWCLRLGWYIVYIWERVESNVDQSREREMFVFCAIYIGSVAANFQCCTQLCNISVRDCKAVIPSRSIPVAFSIPKIPGLSITQSRDFGIEKEAWNYVLGWRKFSNNHNNCSFAQYYLQQHAWQIICMAFVYFFCSFSSKV